MLLLLMLVDFRIIIGAASAAGAVVSQGPQGGPQGPQGPQGGPPEPFLDDFGGYCTSLVSNLFLLRISWFVVWQQIPRGARLLSFATAPLPSRVSSHSPSLHHDPDANECIFRIRPSVHGFDEQRSGE